MAIGIYEFFRPKRQRERLVREFVAVANAMQFDKFGQYLTDDFVFSDTSGGSVAGLAAYIEEEKAFREAAGNPPVVIDSLDHWRGEILLRGHLDTDVEEIAGQTMWRVAFRNKKISSAEVTRDNAGLTVPSPARRRA